MVLEIMHAARVWTASANEISRLLPMLAVLFLCSFLDRTNVGNAKILGLEKTIGITDHQYSIGLAAFYATYIARCACSSSRIPFSD